MAQSGRRNMDHRRPANQPSKLLNENREVKWRTTHPGTYFYLTENLVMVDKRVDAQLQVVT